MSTRDHVYFSVEGFPELVEQIKKLASDVDKRREILKILRRTAAPHKEALRSGPFVPKSPRKSALTGKGGTIRVESGNLRKRMMQFANKKNNKGLIYIHTGPKVSTYGKVDGKKKLTGTGYYGYFLLPGAVRNGWQAQAEKTDWKGDAWKAVEGQVRSATSKELKRYIEMNAKKRGFDVK